MRHAAKTLNVGDIEVNTIQGAENNAKVRPRVPGCQGLFSVAGFPLSLSGSRIEGYTSIYGNKEEFPLSLPVLAST